MADVFISYARGDRHQAEKLSAALSERGLTVWWDRRLTAGAEFSSEIERELAAAGAVLVCWSEDALKSRWVKDEADEAARDSKLVAVSLDRSVPPLGYRQYHCLDLSEWSGDTCASAIDELIDALEQTAGAPSQQLPDTNKLHAKHTEKPAQSRGLLRYFAMALAASVAVLAGYWVISGKYPPTAPSTQTTTSINKTPLTTALPSSTDSEGDSVATAAALPPSASIAVLAFSDLSPNGDQGYFADGLSEEILNVLARVAGLKVASRTSAFAMRDRPDMGIREIAAELGVRHVMEGSVRKAGNTVRITVQLIDAAQDVHLYSETFDRALSAEKLFQLQEEIAKATVGALGERGLLASLDRESVKVAAETNSLEAYEAYLQAHGIFAGREQNRFDAMLALFEQAVEVDPAFARAHSGLSSAYGIMPGWGYQDRPYPELATAAARRALSLDPTLGMPYAVQAEYVCNPHGLFCPERDRLMEQAINAEPNNPALYNFRGQALLDSGFFEEAADDFQRCLDLDPNRILCQAFYMITRMQAGEFDLGLALARELINNSSASLHLIGAAGILSAAGRQSDARALIAAVNSPEFDTRAMTDVLFATEPASPDVVFRAWQQENARMEDILQQFNLKTPPMLAYFYRQFDLLEGFDSFVIWQPFHSDFLQSSIRYQMMEDAGLPNYWRKRGFPDRCRPLPDAAPDERDYYCE